MLPQDNTYLIQRPCFQRGSPCQDPAGNWTTDGLLTIVKRRKLQWYGHVSHLSDLAKTMLQGTVKGIRRQGRQRKRWEDIIRQWTGLEFGRSQRAVKNREKWRKLARKSSVVPQRPSRLRDRWWCLLESLKGVCVCLPSRVLKEGFGISPFASPWPEERFCMSAFTSPWRAFLYVCLHESLKSVSICLPSRVLEERFCMSAFTSPWRAFLYIRLRESWKSVFVCLPSRVLKECFCLSSFSSPERVSSFSSPERVFLYVFLLESLKIVSICLPAWCLNE